MDGADSILELTGGDSPPRRTRFEPDSAAEVAAILAVVPRACRTNAAWAVPLLVESARAGGITNVRRIAYVLATAHHSCHFGAALVEAAGGPERGGGYERYEPGTELGTLLGNTQRGDGERFCGRGFVPIRGRTLYATWSARLSLPDHIVDGVALPFFVAQPAAPARPDIAARILVRGMRDGLFTGIPLGSYVNDKKTDYFNARRVIDGIKNAREVAETAALYQAAIEHVHDRQHQAHMQRLTAAAANTLDAVCDAVERLSALGSPMPAAVAVIDWDGEARQGKFVQLDNRTCALHIGRGTYLRLDIERDLNGVVPPEGRNMALRRSGEVRSAVRHGDVNSWR